jgi:enoyl-CoA hydratase/carnithine racemase
MDAPSSNFAVERDGRKAVLTFTREERLNALDAQTFRDLLAALDEFEGDRELGVVIMTGRGRGFVAGADITGYVDRTVTEYVAFQRLGRLVYDRIERLRQPVIAAVNGFALGGGSSWSWRPISSSRRRTPNSVYPRRSSVCSPAAAAPSVCPAWSAATRPRSCS